MTSIAEARNCSINLDDSNVSNSDYIVSESIEYTADESHNISFISALDKSELDIELEICEQILALDDNDGKPSDSYEQDFENNDLENIFDSPESALESHPGASIDGSYQQCSKSIKLDCSDNVCESAFQSNAETCNDAAEIKLPQIPVECEIKIEDIPFPISEKATEKNYKKKNCEESSDSDSISIKEIKREKIESSIPVEIIVKSENITTDSSDQIPKPAQYNDTNNSFSILTVKEIKSEIKEPRIPVECEVKLEDIPFPIPEETTEKNHKKRNCEESFDSDSISIVYESSRINSKKIKSEIHVRNLNLEVKREKDDDELSLFAENDISTIEEEYEVVGSPDSPQSLKKDCDAEQDVGIRRVSPQSGVVAPQTNVHEERKVSSDVALPETDYLEAEREDIYDSGWESMRNLTTEEERYKMVRKTWETNKIPNPNRNLTYHSYRKRHLKNSSASHIARKRKATSSLDVTHTNPSKRQRSCTFFYDLNIDSLSAEKHKKTAVINNQMQNEVNQLNNIYFQQEQMLEREYYERRNNNAFGQIYNLRHKCQVEMENIKQQYYSMANQASFQLDSGIHKLHQARNEVLQFFKFYKGLNSEDPTVLTASQTQELEDIENIYLQFDKWYKR